MPTEIIGMYAAATGGTQDALASVDIPQDGVITGVDWDMSADLDADTETSQWELSFIATNQITTNDVRGRISSIQARASLTTSGVAMVGITKFVGPMDLRVSGGERVYLHTIGSAGLVAEARVNVHLETAVSAARRSARRR